MRPQPNGVPFSDGAQLCIIGNMLPGLGGCMPYQEYLRAASEGLIVVDLSGRIVETNYKAEQLFGYFPEEMAGQLVEMLLPERFREIYRSHRARFFAAPRTSPMGANFNLVGRHKDGREFPVEVSLTYARETRRGDLIVASVIDITQRLALEYEAQGRNHRVVGDDCHRYCARSQQSAANNSLAG